MNSPQRRARILSGILTFTCFIMLLFEFSYIIINIKVSLFAEKFRVLRQLACYFQIDVAKIQ